MSTSSSSLETSANVLFIGADRSAFQEIRQCLARERRRPIHAHWATKLTTGLTRLRKSRFEAVLVALPEGDELRTLHAVEAAAPGTPVMVVASAEEESSCASRKWEGHEYVIRGRLERRPLTRTLESLIERTSTANAHRAAEELAEVTLHSIGDAILCTDRLGYVTYLNPVAEALTGWSLGEARGRPSSDILRVVDGTTREALRDAVQTALQHDRVMALTADCVLIRRDGSEAAIDDSVAPIHDSSGGLVGAVMVFRDVSEARATSREMSHLAQHDFLTDLPNRVLFTDRLRQALTLARRHQRKLGILFVDCDGFKQINDTLGHGIGDLMLQSVAKRLVASLRNSDTVSRQGGDEFVILLPELENADDAVVCARKIIANLAASHRIGKHDLLLTASIGVAVYPADGRNQETLLRTADSALYIAKQEGGNTYRSSRRELKARTIERQFAEARLRQALERNEFQLYYQPRVNLSTGAVASVEALLRWNHPERGVVSPSEFVPVAEESGLILPIGRWVLGEALRQAEAWRTQGLATPPVAVNVSEVEFRNASFLDTVAKLHAAAGARFPSLELELNESVLLHDIESTEATLRSLTQLGVGLVLCDFGLGYASLNHLKRYPISTVKIDRSFVRDLATDADQRSLVAAIIAVGKSLGRIVVAGGIETEAQLEVLRQLNCDEGQGLQLGPPLTAGEFAACLAQPRRQPASRHDREKHDERSDANEISGRARSFEAALP